MFTLGYTLLHLMPSYGGLNRYKLRNGENYPVLVEVFLGCITLDINSTSSLDVSTNRRCLFNERDSLAFYGGLDLFNAIFRGRLEEIQPGN